MPARIVAQAIRGGETIAAGVPWSAMSREPIADEWLDRAMTLLQRVTSAEQRFSGALHHGEVTMLAAADELEAATRDARVWVKVNPCPDLKLGTHVTWMLNTCAEVAQSTQRAIIDPRVEVQPVMDRISTLLAVIDFHSQTLDAW
jgi:hypothetical protein